MKEAHLRSPVNLSAFRLDDPENTRFVYLSYSKVNEKWNVTHAIERLIFVLEAHHLHTGIQITTNNTNSSRENDP